MDYWLETACQVVGRHFTRIEWEKNTFQKRNIAKRASSGLLNQK